MAENQKVVVTRRRKLTGMWLIPVVACLIGVWMTIAHYRTLGPEIYIEFATADGLEAGKTKIKSLSVAVGTVEEIHLKDDLKGVVVKVQLDRKAASLLREDTQLWVVRPRITSAGVSGLSTLLSGAYIELAPGVGKIESSKTKFIGLEEVPVTPLSAPGLHFKLLSDNPASVSVGDPLIFHGYEVGQVEKTILDPVSKKIVIYCFIKKPFNSLVTSNTRFWNSSGFSLKATPAGFKLHAGSLGSILRGGIAFGLPKNTNPGDAVDNNEEFHLYRDEDSINKITYKYFAEYLLYFESSVRGLEAGAPVLYRGVRMGTVMKVSFDNYADVVAASINEGERGLSIPVLVRFEPGRWFGEDTAESLSIFKDNIAKNVADGARASIATGNLLTGSRVVTVDFIDDAEPATMEKSGEFMTIPTVSAGLEDVERKISEILNKINQMPLNQVMNDTSVMINKLTSAIETADKTVLDLHTMLGSKDAQQLPNSINTTLNELKEVLEGLSPESSLYNELSNSIEQLNETLHNIESVTHTMDTKPSSLIFSKPKPQDIQPEVPKQ